MLYFKTWFLVAYYEIFIATSKFEMQWNGNTRVLPIRRSLLVFSEVSVWTVSSESI